MLASAMPSRERGRFNKTTNMSIGKQKNRDDGYVNISTKVPPHVADFLQVFAAAKGTDIYGLLQLFVQTIIRAAKCETELPPSTKLLMHMLEIDKDWNRAFNFSSPSAMTDVAQVILVLQQHDGKGDSRRPRKGFGLMMIDKPALPGSKPKVTYCVDDILERVAEVSMQGLYKELRQIGVKAKTKSLRETLMQLCDAYKITLMDEEMEEELPDLGNYHDFGRVVEWCNKMKQRKHRTPDSLANSQQRSLFDDFDRETGMDEGNNTAADVEDAMGCKPFGEEP